MGTRPVPFARVLYIEQDDFREDPPKKYYRLFPGNEVRLRYAYIVRCVGVVQGRAHGRARGGALRLRPGDARRDAPGGQRVRGTIHWVSAAHAVEAVVRLYESPVRHPVPGGAEDGDWKADLNPASLERLVAVAWSRASARPRPVRVISSSAQGISAPTRRTPRPASCVQPRRVPARLLGQDREGGEGLALDTAVPRARRGPAGDHSAGGLLHLAPPMGRRAKGRSRGIRPDTATPAASSGLPEGEPSARTGLGVEAVGLALSVRRARANGAG